MYTLHAQEKGHSFVIDGHHEIHFGYRKLCALGGTAAYRMCRDSVYQLRKNKVTYIHVLW